MKFASKIFTVGSLLSIFLLLFGGIASAQQVQFTTPIAVVNSSFLNVRTGPGVQYETLLTVVGGTEFPVLGIASDRVWYQVSTVVGVGWVNSEFTIPRGSFTNIPMVDTRNFVTTISSSVAAFGLPDGQGGGVAFIPSQTATSPTTTISAGGTFIAGTDPVSGNPIIISGAGERFRAAINIPAVELRSAPGDNQPSLGLLFQSDTLDYPIVGRGRDTNGVEWLSIVTPNFGTGWVDAPKLNLRLSGAFQTVMVVTADTVAMGDGPGTGSGSLPQLSGGTEAFLRNISQDGNFIQIELGGGEIGWIPFSAARQRTETVTDGLGLTPSSAPVLAAGVDGQGGGAVTGTTQLPAPFSLSTPRVIINTAFLNVRSGPGAQYTSVTTLSGGTELPVLGVAKDRVWYLIEGRFGRGWINSEFTIFRGVMDNVPVVNTDVVIAGQLDKAVAVISAPTVLYAAPGTNFGSIGSVSGPQEVTIVARTADSAWLQVSTNAGFGWVLASQVVVRGNTSQVPVVS